MKKYQLVLGAICALTFQQAQATVMNFQVSPFSAAYAQFERVTSSSADGIIGIESLAEKPGAMQYQLHFGQLKQATDTGINSFGWGGTTHHSRTATYNGITQHGDQGLQFFCSYLALTAAECAFDSFSSFLELNLTQTQYEDGSVSNSVNAAIRYQAVKAEAGDETNQTNTSTYRRNFMFNDWSMQDWGVTLPNSKDLLNWLSGSAKVYQVSEQLVLTSESCSEESCSTESTLYNLMVPGSTNWVIEEVSTPATASFMLLGIAAVFLRRQRRSH